MASQIKIKRLYTVVEKSDGRRILVDRLWPRGIARSEAALDDWARAIAPSNEIRRQFGHDPARFPAFARAYRAELNANPAARVFLATCRDALQTGDVTFLYAAKDPLHNNAAVLLDWAREALF